MVVLLSVFVLGGAGASQLPGCEGEGGPVSFGVVLFWEEWRRVSFRGLWRGKRASQLWSLVVVSSPSVFVLGGAGASQLPGCEGGNVLSQLWSLVVVASPSSLSSSSCCLFLFWGGAGASQLPGL